MPCGTNIIREQNNTALTDSDNAFARLGNIKQDAPPHVRRYKRRTTQGIKHGVSPDRLHADQWHSSYKAQGVASTDVKALFLKFFHQNSTT
jgi:hypothetical protein